MLDSQVCEFTNSSATNRKTIAAAISATESAIRRSCWRCSPLLCRSRFRTETTEATRPTLIRMNPMVSIIPRTSPTSSPWVTRSKVAGSMDSTARKHRASPIPSDQATYRQRRE